MLDRSGALLERLMDRLESRAAGTTAGAVLFGVVMGLGVVAAGIGLFLLALAVLVGVFA